MSAITHDHYNDFGKTSYINYSYIPETFCVGSVGQYIWTEKCLPNLDGLCRGLGPPGVLGIWGEWLFIFRDLGSTGNYFWGSWGASL